MKVITVVFGKMDGEDFIASPKQYEFLSDLDLVIGGIYKITADEIYPYNNPVQVLKTGNNSRYERNLLRIITAANSISLPKRKPNPIARVIFNEDKKCTIVIWIDGTKTKVFCQEGDTFDKEKGIMACFFKRFFDNRGYYNEYIKNWTE